jgi:hypothetical protein
MNRGRVPIFRPTELLQSLSRHQLRYVVIGAFAATLHGSPLRTNDADICPAHDRENLELLSRSLIDLEARIRAEGEPLGLEFDCNAEFLSRVEIWNLVTRFGPLDISFRPSGTGGYEDLVRAAVTYPIGNVRVRVASLLDVIRSKEAANRPKDRDALPVLRELLARTSAKEAHK